MAMQDPGRATGFPCKQCNMVCSSLPSLIDHMDVHIQQEEERKFKCDECGRGYRHAGSLANHKKTHDVGSFQCNICGKQNSNALALKSHIRSHTSPKKYSCLECGKGFRLATQLATHERVHLTRRAKQGPHQKEDVEFAGNERENDHNNYFDEQPEDGISYEAQHESSEDASDRPFRCDLCDKSYIHLRSLANHKKTHQVGTFECNVCLKLFNNLAALYSHQRSHKTKSVIDPAETDHLSTGPTLDQFAPPSRDSAVNFCHLCQVLFPSDGEFQEHIHMHNSSSASFGLHEVLSDTQSLTYDNSIASPRANLYVSPVNSVSSVLSVNNVGFDAQQEQIINGHMYSDCSNNQAPSCNNTQGEPECFDTNVASPQNSNSASAMEESSAGDSEERPFKCQICGKTYRHSGSLINHKRSHQVGIYQCSVCRKSYPHLAALKSHLRLHKGQRSLSHGTADDWLSSEPLTLENQQHCFSSQDEENDGQPLVGIHQENGVDCSNEGMYPEQFSRDFSQDPTAHLPRNEHLMQRHMCADCGETFADIAGIKSHSCPLLQQQQNSMSSPYDNINLQASSGCRLNGNPISDDAEFTGLNGQNQSYFEQEFQGNTSRAELSSNRGDSTNSEEDEEDGDLYQCSICGNSYTNMRSLRSHLRGHTQTHDAPTSSGPSSLSSQEDVKDDDGVGGEMMICSTCGESFGSRQDLTAHQLLHNNNNNNNQDRDRVGDVSPPRLSDGYESKEEPQNIICGSCGIFCSSYHHLENHGCPTERENESSPGKEESKVNDVIQREEGGGGGGGRGSSGTEARQYKCDQCGRSYRHAGSLLNHKKSHKTGVFRCLVCQKRFYNLLALKNHQRSHFDIKRHKCHECGKAFKIQKQLSIHLRRHKENQAKIQELNNQIQALMQMNGTGLEEKPQPSIVNSKRQCKRVPEGKTDRTGSEATVKSEDPDDHRPFACDQCGRTYRHAGSLVNHRNSHKTGDYCCSVCNNTYSNQLAMKNHLRTHVAHEKHCCQRCGKGFRGKKQLLAHSCTQTRGGTRRGLRSRALKCRKCHQTFPTVDQLGAHVCDRRAHSDRAHSDRAHSDRAQANASPNADERPFTCDVCNRSYRHAGSLLNHKNTHKTGHFSCTFCSKPFTNPMALRNHTRIHTQKKKYVCLTCGKAFRLASILHNHQKVHSRVENHFSCSACGKSFQGRSGLKRHRCYRGRSDAQRSDVRRSDRGDRCFMCDLCGRSYRHAGSLLNHKQSHSEKLHHCTLCLQSFPDPLTLQIHSQMRRHCCPECGKTFCLTAHLQSHMEVHSQGHRANRWHAPTHPSSETDPTGTQVPPPLSHLPRDIANSQENEGRGGGGAADDKSHVCEHCGRTYRHAGSLLNHKNSHKTGSFSCSVCRKEFTNLMALKNHRRIHTEPKRYQCQECGKAFRVSTQLVCHRRIHTKEKPFSCPLCHKSFSSKSNLRHHHRMHQSFSMDASTFMDLDMASFL